MENVVEASRARRRDADSSVLSSRFLLFPSPQRTTFQMGMQSPPMRFNFSMRNIGGCL